MSRNHLISFLNANPKSNCPLPPLATSPYGGEGDIALTREFVVRFNMPFKEGSVITNEMFHAYSAGELQVTSVAYLPTG